ncbi:DUF7096 domain-containing protein [Haloferacaceae archaeon DSL9]
MKSLPIILAGLLVLSSVGVGAFAEGVGAPEVAVEGDRHQIAVAETPDTERNILAVRNVTRSAQSRHHADLGSGVGIDVDATTASVSTAGIERRIAGAESESDRQIAILSELNVIEQRTVSLRQRQRSAIDGYGSGSISEQALVAELARITLEARELRARLALLEQAAEETEDYSIDNNRRDTLEHELRIFEGPVRDHATAIIQGVADANRIYIETGERSVTLATVIDDTYVRETYRGDRRDRGASSIDPDAAQNITAEQYPTIWEHRRSTSAFGPESVVTVRVSHGGGELETFVDGGTNLVFKEHQTLDLQTITVGETTTKTQDGLDVTVNQTYPGGPIQIAVFDAEEGEPVDATIRIGQDGEESETVGETDDAGSLWTLTPSGSFTITVVGADTSIAFVDVDARDPPALPEASEVEDGDPDEDTESDDDNEDGSSGSDEGDSGDGDVDGDGGDSAVDDGDDEVGDGTDGTVDTSGDELE